MIRSSAQSTCSNEQLRSMLCTSLVHSQHFIPPIKPLLKCLSGALKGPCQQRQSHPFFFFGGGGSENRHQLKQSNTCSKEHTQKKTGKQFKSALLFVNVTEACNSKAAYPVTLLPALSAVCLIGQGFICIRMMPNVLCMKLSKLPGSLYSFPHMASLAA